LPFVERDFLTDAVQGAACSQRQQQKVVIHLVQSIEFHGETVPELLAKRKTQKRAQKTRSNANLSGCTEAFE
jgi:hypothetical protein